MTEGNVYLVPEKSSPRPKLKTKYYLAATFLIVLVGGSLTTWYLISQNNLPASTPPPNDDVNSQNDSTPPQNYSTPPQNDFTPPENDFTPPQNDSNHPENNPPQSQNNPDPIPVSGKPNTKPAPQPKNHPVPITASVKPAKKSAKSNNAKPPVQPGSHASSKTKVEPSENAPIDFKTKFGWIPNPPAGIELEDESELEDEIQADPKEIRIRPAPLEQVKLKERNVKEGIQEFDSKLIGLANTGNSCFMNAVIQMFYHDNAFRTGIQRELANAKIPGDQLKRLKALNRLFKRMDSAKKAVMKPSRTALMPPELATIGNQEDAHEALMHIIGEGDWSENTLNIDARLHEMYPASTGLIDVRDVVDSHLPIEIKIKKEHPDRPPQSLQDLVDKQLTLTDTLVPLGANEVQAGLQHKIMRRGLFKTPKSLLIQVGRMTYDPITQTSGKNHAPIDVPDTLKIVSRKTGQTAIYKLKSFVYHQGNSANDGHYFTFLRQDDSKYVRLDDSQVIKDLDAEAIQQFKNTGYIYLYQLEQDLVPVDEDPENYL